MPDIFATVINARLATKRELETIYDLDDVLDMVEMVQVKSYNEWVATMRDNKRGR